MIKLEFKIVSFLNSTPTSFRINLLLFPRNSWTSIATMCSLMIDWLIVRQSAELDHSTGYIQLNDHVWARNILEHFR